MLEGNHRRIEAKFDRRLADEMRRRRPSVNEVCSWLSADCLSCGHNSTK